MDVPIYRTLNNIPNAHFLRVRVLVKLPRCRKFTARLFDVQTDQLKLNRVIAKKGKDPDRPNAMAWIHMRDRDAVFWNGYLGLFNEHQSNKRLGPCIVHELAHLLITRKLVHLNDHVKKYLIEGICDFAAELYFKNLSLMQKILSDQLDLFLCALNDLKRSIFAFFGVSQDQSSDSEYEIDKYEIGRLFIGALYRAGFSIDQILNMISKTPPHFGELFFPTQYLDRLKVDYVSDKDVSPANAASWKETAVRFGIEYAGGTKDFVSFPSRLNAFGNVLFILSIYPLALGFHMHKTICNHLEALDFHTKGVPVQLMPDPKYYGIRFVKNVVEARGSVENAIKILEEYPPENFVGTPPTIGDMIEPSIYLSIVHVIQNLKRDIAKAS